MSDTRVIKGRVVTTLANRRGYGEPWVCTIDVLTTDLPECGTEVEVHVPLTKRERQVKAVSEIVKTSDVITTGALCGRIVDAVLGVK